MIYATLEAFALARVREACKFKCRWAPDLIEKTRSGMIVDYQPRHRLDNDRAGMLAELCEHRRMLGPRWTNPIAWAVGLGLAPQEDAVLAGMIRKLEGSGK